MTLVKRFRLTALVAVLPVALGLEGCRLPNLRPVAGLRLTVANFADSPSRNFVRFVSEDRANLTFPVRGSVGDPTLYGARAVLANPTTHQQDFYDLPAANWAALPEGTGYRYIDADQHNGPCRSVRLIEGRRLTVSCSGTKMHFKLDEEHQGTLGFDLLLFAGAQHETHYCTWFGGAVLSDVAVSPAGTGRFLAVHAPAQSCIRFQQPEETPRS